MKRVNIQLSSLDPGEKSATYLFGKSRSFKDKRILHGNWLL